MRFALINLPFRRKRLNLRHAGRASGKCAQASRTGGTGLADEILLFVYPVLLGKGKRFFSDGTPPRELRLTSAKAASSGVIISTYTPAGPLRTGSS
jgi:hypothetical protein